MAKSRKGKPENLISLADRTTEEREGIAKKGGIASGRARRLKKQLSMMQTVKRHEIEFFDDLDIILSGISEEIKIKRQFCIGKYRIDGFIPVYNIAIEYDEEQHSREVMILADRERQKDIDSIIKMKWIRVSKGSEVYGFRDVVSALTCKENK